MVDGIELNAGTGGAIVNTDDIAGVHSQIVKHGYGALDSLTLAASGAGAVSAGVQRVTLASDDPAVTALQILDNAISGSEMQVDVVGALPAGTNAIGKLAANSGVDIGDVDVTSVIPGTGATNLGKAIDTATGATDTGVLVLVTRDDALGALTPIEGDNVALRVDANGALWTHDDVLEAALSGSELQVDVVAALPAGNNNIGDVDVASIAAGDNNIGNVDIVTVPAPLNVVGTGTEAAALRVTIATDSTGVLSVDDNGGSLTVDNAQLSVVGSGTEAAAMRVTIATDSTGVLSVDDNGGSLTVDVGTALPAGTNAIGKLAANSGVDIGDVDVTSISAGTNNIGNVGLIGRTSGGMTIFRSIDIDESEEEIKATAGQVFSIAAFNRTAAPLYLKFYNATAANVTVGTTTPVLTFVVPANADSDGAGFIWNNTIGFAFGTAITVAATTGVADNDTGAPGANDCVINVGYA